MNYSIAKNRAGFTLIAAMLVATLLVTVGAALSSIALRRVKLSISARESSKAFFAADSWLECVMYNDLTLNKFSDLEDLYSLNCGGSWEFESLGSCPTESGESAWQKCYQVESTANMSGLCANVTLYKLGNKSKIISRGYNTCTPTDPKRVERALRVTYE